MFTGIDKQIDGLKNISELDSIQVDKLKAELKKLNLFTKAESSAKLAKNLKFTKFESYILYMSPADLAFKFLDKAGTLCPYASAGCKAACLNTAGIGRFDSVASARLRKSLYYILFKEQFIDHVFNEVAKLERKAIKSGKKLVIRLNGTTDLDWTRLTNNGANIFDSFKSVQFYDYTKIIGLAKRSLGYKNYSVTFSAAENNDLNWQAALDLGINVAMVFSARPETYHGIKVIDGDLHDLRFLDVNNGSGVIVGLTAKGKAKQDKSGFVKHCNAPLITQKIILNFIDTKQLNKGA